MASGTWIYERTSPTGGGSGTGATAAPNVTAAVPTFTPAQIAGAPVLHPSALVTLPVAHADYAHLVALRVRIHAPDTTFTGTGAPLYTVNAPFAPDGSGNITVTLPPMPQDTKAHTYDWTFEVLNEDGRPSASPLQVANVAAPAAAGPAVPPPNVSTVTGGEVASSRYPEIGTRLVRAKFDATVTLSADQGTQTWTLWLSRDNGANWLGINWYPASGLTGTARIDQAIAESNETWKFAAQQGRVPFNAGILIPNANLPAGAIRQTTGFLVTGFGLPNPSQGLGAAALPGVGGTFPYNAQTNDGSQYWHIPGFEITLDTAYADPNVGTINVTFTDLDAAGNPIGPEHIYTGVRIVQGRVNIGDLDGEYGPFGDTYTRKFPYPGGVATNIAKVRAKFYGSSRKDQTTSSWSNPAASVLLTDTVSGVGYLDTVVAVGGAIPPGKILASRIDPASLDPSLVQRVADGKLAMNTGNLANLLFNPGFEEGVTGWVPHIAGYAIVSSPVFSGTKALQFPTGTGGDWAGLFAQDIPCRPGDEFYGELWHQSAATVGGIFLIYYYLDAAKAWVGNDSYSDGVSATWKRLGGRAIIPPGASYLRVFIGSGGASNAPWYIDNAFVREQVPAGHGMAPDGASGGVKLNTGNLSNILFNGSFEEDLRAWGKPYDAPNSSIDPTVAYTGTKSLKVTTTASWVLVDQAFTLRPNDEFYFEIWYRSGGAFAPGAIRIHFQTYDSAGIQLEGRDVASGPPSAGWAKISGTDRATMATAATGRVLVGTYAGDGTYWIDNVFVAPKITFGTGQLPYQAKISGPLYEDTYKALNLNVSSDFTAGGVLTQAAVDLFKAYNFNGAEFEKSGSVLNVKALTVSKLAAGTAIFTGAATFAYTAAGPFVQVGSAGVILADNVAAPTSTVTITSVGITIAKGTPKVEITASGVKVSNGASYYVDVTATGVNIVGGSLTSPSISGGSLSITTSGGMSVTINNSFTGVRVSLGSDVTLHTSNGIDCRDGSYITFLRKDGLELLNGAYIRVGGLTVINGSGQHSGSWSGSFSATSYGGGSTSSGSISVYSLSVGSGGISLSGAFSVFSLSIGSGGVMYNGSIGATQNLTIRDSGGGFCTIAVNGGTPIANRLNFSVGGYVGQI